MRIALFLLTKMQRLRYNELEELKPEVNEMKDTEMKDQIQKDFLRKRMIELRNKNQKTLSDMARLINCNKSTLSRVETIGDPTSYKTVLEYANLYCEKLGVPQQEIEIFLRGERMVVTDTSALLKNLQLIEELSKEFSLVIVPDVVVDELDYIKDHNKALAAKAWQLLSSIRTNANAITMPYEGPAIEGNDKKIIAVAQQAAKKYGCKVEIITNDAGFAARLKRDEREDSLVSPLYIENYLATKQNLVNTAALGIIDSYYADTYDDIEKQLGIKTPSGEDLNAYLSSGFTLIISAVRNKKYPLEQRKKKILWLISHGADINKRDNARYYFPPLTHSIQTNDYGMFKFLLNECKANPNVGSRNPYDVGKIRNKNDGNMPLMVAAWHNRIDFVRDLCADPRTSLNQQDGNGFTALIKASIHGSLECRNIIIKAGADQKIVDRDGYTHEDRYHEFLETGGWHNHK